MYLIQNDDFSIKYGEHVENSNPLQRAVQMNLLQNVFINV